jgi:hypothetical protein
MNRAGGLTTDFREREQTMVVLPERKPDKAIPDAIRRKSQEDPTASVKKVGRMVDSSHTMVTGCLKTDFSTKRFHCPP